MMLKGINVLSQREINIWLFSAAQISLAGWTGNSKSNSRGLRGIRRRIGAGHLWNVAPRNPMGRGVVGF